MEHISGLDDAQALPDVLPDGLVLALLPEAARLGQLPTDVRPWAAASWGASDGARRVASEDANPDRLPDQMAWGAGISADPARVFPVPVFPVHHPARSCLARQDAAVEPDKRDAGPFAA